MFIAGMLAGCSPSDYGGNVGVGQSRLAAEAQSHRRVELTAVCYSDCTTQLGDPDTCTAEKADFGFHAVTYTRPWFVQPGDTFGGKPGNVGELLPAGAIAPDVDQEIILGDIARQHPDLVAWLRRKGAMTRTALTRQTGKQMHDRWGLPYCN